MRSEQPIAEALAEVVLDHARKLDKRLLRARRGDVDGVHDGRTMLRRLRTELKVMGDTAFDPREAARIEARLAQVEGALGKARDTDVLLADLDRYARRHRADGLAPLRAALGRRRKRSARAARRVLGARERKRAARALKRLAAAPNPSAPRDGVRARPCLVRHFTHEEIWSLYDAVRAFDTRLPEDPEVLHKLRAACRRLRFGLELFAAALPRANAIARELHALQNEVGRMHDHHVAAELLEKWRKRRKLRGGAIAAYAKHHAQERERLKKRAAVRWNDVLGHDFRERLAAALEVES
jgi:CHAD domain-containing protein